MKLIDLFQLKNVLVSIGVFLKAKRVELQIDFFEKAISPLLT